MNKASTILRSGDTQAGGENKKENLKFSFDFSETLLTPSFYNPQPIHPGSWRRSFHLPFCPLICGVEPASRFRALFRGLMTIMYGRAPGIQGASSGHSVTVHPSEGLSCLGHSVTAHPSEGLSCLCRLFSVCYWSCLTGPMGAAS